MILGKIKSIDDHDAQSKEKQSPEENPDYQTYDGWKKLGRQVSRGQKYKKRHVGEYYFHKSQTRKKEVFMTGSTRSIKSYHDSLNWEYAKEMDEHLDLGESNEIRKAN